MELQESAGSKKVDEENETLEEVSVQEVSKMGTRTFVLNMKYPGSFFFQVEYATTYEKRYSEPSYIFVEPRFEIPGNPDPISINQLSILTVLSRSLGPLNRWD
mmetsp:Transcript_17973/g.12991  ORF Transcript_17973/g.12991 Transcript_17973/m.12991 type:complete len:103 (+) Transcript_17973:263-571(+)